MDPSRNGQLCSDMVPGTCTVLRVVPKATDTATYRMNLCELKLAAEAHGTIPRSQLSGVELLHGAASQAAVQCSPGMPAETRLSQTCAQAARQAISHCPPEQNLLESTLVCRKHCFLRVSCGTSCSMMHQRACPPRMHHVNMRAIPHIPRKRGLTESSLVLDGHRHCVLGVQCSMSLRYGAVEGNAPSHRLCTCRSSRVFAGAGDGCAVVVILISKKPSASVDAARSLWNRPQGLLVPRRSGA